MYADEVRKSDVIILAISMICFGFGIILVLLGILDPPGYQFWVVTAAVVMLGFSYRMWGKKGALSVVGFLLVAGLFYLGYLCVVSILGSIEETRKQLLSGAYDVELARMLFAGVVVGIQVVVLLVLLLKASDEKRTPFGLLKGYLVVVVIAGLAIAFAPFPWGTPYLVWGTGVTLTSLVRVTKVVGLTTNYFKPKGDGNRTIAVHDDGAISGSLSDLIWGHGVAFVIATASVVWFAWLW